MQPIIDKRELQSIKKQTEKHIVDYKILKNQLKIEKDKLKQAEKSVKDYSEAQLLVQNIAQNIQQKAHKQIEQVVSRCLKSVFGDVYGFKINFNKKRGKTEAVLALTFEDEEIEDAMNSDSGGVIDVASLSLRIACLLLSRPEKSKVLIMDEPFKNLDIINRENLKILLEKLSSEFNLQFIIVTHEKEFQIGNIIKV
jgi:ABC-type dipeptide/oligopeptide/nickel transport system ATPase subunit